MRTLTHTVFALTLALAAAIVFSAPAPFAASTPRSQLSVSIKTPTGRTVIAMHATETSVGQFRGSGRIVRVPCQGRFKFTAASHDLVSGAVNRFVADLYLSRPVVHGLRCGRRVPRGYAARYLVVTFSGSERANESISFEISGRERADGVLAGRLTIRGLPCSGRYRVVGRLASHTRLRTARYAAHLRNVRLNGVRRDRCG